jgi:hypothetical protein
MRFFRSYRIGSDLCQQCSPNYIDQLAFTEYSLQMTLAVSAQQQLMRLPPYGALDHTGRLGPTAVAGEEHGCAAMELLHGRRRQTGRKRSGFPSCGIRFKDKCRSAGAGARPQLRRVNMDRVSRIERTSRRHAISRRAEVTLPGSILRPVPKGVPDGLYLYIIRRFGFRFVDDE